MVATISDDDVVVVIVVVAVVKLTHRNRTDNPVTNVWKLLCRLYSVSGSKRMFPNTFEAMVAKFFSRVIIFCDVSKLIYLLDCLLYLTLSFYFCYFESPVCVDHKLPRNFVLEDFDQ